MDWRQLPRCDQTPVWAALQAHFARRFTGAAAFDLRRAFAEDAVHVEHFSLQAPGVFADLSKNLIDAEAQQLLLQLARACGVEAHRDAMFAGERINTSEKRAVTHVQWRMPAGAVHDAGSTAAEAQRVRAEMLAFAESVRSDAAITDVVNIGVGGSDLGPRLVVQALRSTGHASGPRLHFVANMDGHELAELLPQLNAGSTLFLIASKTFGTAETTQNAVSARSWFRAQGGTDVARHFVALSANQDAAAAFGVGRCFGFDEGVGGRFSLWSPIGLSIALAAGAPAFGELLAGAHAMDQHFTGTPLEQNLPVQLALLDLWHRNFHGFGSRCVAPYHHGLRRLPAHLQQLEMESNGKGVDLQGRQLQIASAPVTWGEAGSNSQHAFFQMLHQGSEVVPVEFILVQQASHALPGHHAKLLANALAQARALMLGQAGDAPERRFPGNRPSTVLLLPDLAPRSLGALLALYEHRSFVLGSLWGVNSFDQWGVELGKTIAQALEPRLHDGELAGLDGSTAGLIERIRRR